MGGWVNVGDIGDGNDDKSMHGGWVKMQLQGRGLGS